MFFGLSIVRFVLAADSGASYCTTHSLSLGTNLGLGPLILALTLTQVAMDDDDMLLQQALAMSVAVEGGSGAGAPATEVRVWPLVILSSTLHCFCGPRRFTSHSVVSPETYLEFFHAEWLCAVHDTCSGGPAFKSHVWFQCPNHAKTHLGQRPLQGRTRSAKPLLP